MNQDKDVDHPATSTNVPYQSELAVSGQPLLIISQLLHVIDNIRTIDDLFIWLTQAISHHLNLEVIQFWLQKRNAVQHPTAIELRTMTCHNATLPRQIVLNTYITEVIERVFKDHQGIMPQPGEQVFSPRLTTLLKQHHLHYWGCYFLYSSARVPATGRHTLLQSEYAPPLVMAVSFFTHELPFPQLLSTIGVILEQAIAVAKKRGLLLTGESSSSTSLQFSSPSWQRSRSGPLLVQTSESHPVQNASTSLLDLVPQRSLPNDPATGTLLPPDQAVRQLYQLIDGYKPLSSIFTFSRMNKETFLRALRALVSQKYIQLYERSGRQIESERILQVL